MDRTMLAQEVKQMLEDRDTAERIERSAFNAGVGAAFFFLIVAAGIGLWAMRVDSKVNAYAAQRGINVERNR